MKSRTHLEHTTISILTNTTNVPNVERH